MKAWQKRTIVGFALLIRILVYLMYLSFLLAFSFLLSFSTVEFLDFEVLDHKPYSGSGPLENELNPLIWFFTSVYFLVPVYFFKKWKNKSNPHNFFMFQD